MRQLEGARLFFGRPKDARQIESAPLLEGRACYFGLPKDARQSESVRLLEGGRQLEEIRYII